jgi:hypothetical protein
VGLRAWTSSQIGQPNSKGFSSGELKPFIFLRLRDFDFQIRMKVPSPETKIPTRRQTRGGIQLEGQMSARENTRLGVKGVARKIPACGQSSALPGTSLNTRATQKSSLLITDFRLQFASGVRYYRIRFETARVRSLRDSRIL